MIEELHQLYIEVDSNLKKKKLRRIKRTFLARHPGVDDKDESLNGRDMGLVVSYPGAGALFDALVGLCDLMSSENLSSDMILMQFEDGTISKSDLADLNMMLKVSGCSGAGVSRDKKNNSLSMELGADSCNLCKEALGFLKRKVIKSLRPVCIHVCFEDEDCK